MKIAFVSSEIFPYAKTGGLADVSGSLPKALEQSGCEVKLFIPQYYSIDQSKFGLHYNWDVGEIIIKIGSNKRAVHLNQSRLPGSDVEVNFIDCPHYYHRDQIYTDGFDEDERFILFNKAVIEVLQRLKWAPDVIHCNDWTTGLLPLFLKDNYGWDKLFSNTAALYTIHNIGYQGRFLPQAVKKAGIRDELFYPGSPIEADGQLCFMKSGIMYSEIINTVSETYAKEILTPEYGADMENSLTERKEDLYGIINGVDYSMWDPSVDEYLPHKYSDANINEKAGDKRFLLERMKLKYDADVPVIGIVSRMASQKGFDLIEAAAEELMKLNAQWVVLGSGEEKYEDMFRSLSQKFKEKVAVHIGFNNELSHLIEAGSDMFLMPSHYEPCGLNQIYSLKYGTVPVVRNTGGLADTVLDWHEQMNDGLRNGTGFKFNDYTGAALFSAVERAVNTFANKEVWFKIRDNGMKENFSWQSSASKYIKLYEKAVEKRKLLF